MQEKNKYLPKSNKKILFPNICSSQLSTLDRNFKNKKLYLVFRLKKCRRGH